MQRRLHIKSGKTPNKIQGYLTGDPRQRAAQRAQEGPAEFYLALGPLGATGGYLRTRLPVRLVTPTAPTPEAHPGLTMPPIFIGIELMADSQGHFDRSSGQ